MNGTIVRPVPGTAPLNGLPEWRPYVYKGTGTDTLTPHLDLEELPADLRPCYCGGDMRGYRRHLEDGEEPCRESRDYANAYHRARKKRENRCGTCGYLRSSQNHLIVCGGAS